MTKNVGVPVTPEVGKAIHATLDAASARLAPWRSALAAPLTFAERQDGLRASFPPDVADRLARIGTGYDPDGLFVANHTD